MLTGCTSWPDNLVSKYKVEKYWKEITIGEAFDQAAAKYSAREALVYGELRLTYEELSKKVDQLALEFIDMGLKPLDRVVMQLPNRPEFVYTYLAFTKIGVIPVMCLPAHRESEIVYIAQHTEAKGHVIPGVTSRYDYTALAQEVKKNVPSLKHVFVAGESSVDEHILIHKLLNDSEKSPPEKAEIFANNRPDPYNAAVFQLSGGTTGMPKIIPRTHTDYVYNSLESGSVGGIDQDTVFLVTTPIAHNFALACPGIQAALFAGGKIVIPESHHPADVFATIEKEGVTYVPAVPAMIINWINSPDVKNYDLSSWQVVISGGAKLNSEVARKVKPVLGCKLQQIFGMAEGLLIMTKLDDPYEVIYETIGKPISPGDELIIIDEDEKEVLPWEEGEMVCQGPYTIRGYYKADEHNKKAFTRDGFFKSGDVMRRRPDGNLVVEGRNKDLINRGGEKISAEEIENLILSHPAVENAAVVAMPDPVLGERGCAFVSLKGQETLELESLNAYLLDKKIAKFKLPERLEIVKEFPLTNVGKISKKDLRDLINNKLSQEESTA